MVISALKKTKARFIGESEPDFVYGRIYDTFQAKWSPKGNWIVAENKYGEAYLMPEELFVPIEEENREDTQ